MKNIRINKKMKLIKMVMIKQISKIIKSDKLLHNVHQKYLRAMTLIVMVGRLALEYLMIAKPIQIL